MDKKSFELNTPNLLVIKMIVLFLIAVSFVFSALDFVVLYSQRVVVLPTDFHFFENFITPGRIPSLVVLQKLLAAFLIIVTVSLIAFSLSRKEIFCSKKTCVFIITVILASLFAEWLMSEKIILNAPHGLRLSYTLIFSGLLVWLYLSMNSASTVKVKPPFGFLILVFFLVIIFLIQIVSGVSVSANNAGLACPDWPLCKGELVPSVFGNVGLQVIHRFWGYLFMIFIFAFVNLCRRFKKQSWITDRILKSSYSLAVILGLQILTGVMSVFWGAPVILGAAHLMLVFGMAFVFVYLIYESV